MPIVFVITPDPVGAGYVDSLSRPGGNATGFMMFEYILCGNGENCSRRSTGYDANGCLRDAAITAGTGQFAVIQSVAPALGMEVNPHGARDATEIERAITAFAQSANGDLIVTASAWAAAHRELIGALAARHKLPAVYYEREYVDACGSISYGSNFLDQCRRAAGDVNRILKGGSRPTCRYRRRPNTSL